MNPETWAPERGQIVWIDFSPTMGNEQAGHRPALVLSRDRFNRLTGRAMLAPISSRVRGWPFQVELGQGEPVQGVVLVDQARLMDWRSRRLKPAGRASDDLVQAACAMLASIIGF